jgi:diphthine-ammonia ligase
MVSRFAGAGIDRFERCAARSLTSYSVVHPPTLAAAVLWTGGKDSSLALHEAREMGMHIRCLVTFVPRNPVFLAHPLPFLEQQALVAGLPHIRLLVNEPFKPGYVAAIRSLKRDGIGTLVTGDIAEVAGHSNWIGECARRLGMRVVRPLWRREREEILEQLLALRFGVVFSCVKKPWLAEDWLGRELDYGALEQLRAIRERNGLDLCGENGEYHTLVTDAPFFRKRVCIVEWALQAKDSLAYMAIRQMKLVSKMTAKEPQALFAQAT